MYIVFTPEKMFFSVIYIIALIFICVSVIGIIKMPNLYCKAQYAGIVESFVIPIVIISLITFFAELVIGIKLLFLMFCIFVASTTSAHCLCSVYYTHSKNTAESGK